MIEAVEDEFSLHLTCVCLICSPVDLPIHCFVGTMSLMGATIPGTYSACLACWGWATRFPPACICPRRDENCAHDIRVIGQVGTVKEGLGEFFSARLSKKERKKTLVDELLVADEKFRCAKLERRGGVVSGARTWAWAGRSYQMYRR